MTRSLIWKEWHEQRWKLGFGCLVLSALTFVGLRSRVVADETFLNGVCVLAMSLLPLLACMGLIAPERSDGSLSALLALPIASWRVLAVKTLLGVALCVVPMLAAAAISVATAGGREISTGNMIGLWARSAAVSLSLFAWMLGLSIRLPTEARAGMICLGVLVFWAMILAALPKSHNVQVSDPFDILPRWVWVVCPFVFGFPNAVRHQAMPLVVQLTIAVALWWAAVRWLTVASEERS
jgi:hypothetical protein